MKTPVIIHLLLFLLLMMVSQCASAQDYVLTTRGDSVAGEVRPLFYGTEKRVQVVSGDREKSTFTIFQVKAFSSEGDIYHPVKGDNGYAFMKLLKPGYLSLYAYQMENQTRFDGLLLKKLDGEVLSVPNLGFKKYMSRFLEDCPSVSERIQAGEFSKKEIDVVVDAYNACVENRTIDHNKVVAQREEQSTKINLWDSLEEKIRQQEFSEKNNALEMIEEIRKKISRQESIPNFLLEGLRNSLKDTGLSQDVEKAIDEIQ